MSRVCSATIATGSFPDASNDNIINHFETTQAGNRWRIYGARHLIKVFAPLPSQCAVTLQLFFENFLQDRGSAAKECQQTLVVYFCSPLWCVLAKSNRLSPAWLCEAVQEGPIAPDGGLIAASEWVWSSGCSPRTTTSDRLKLWPLLKQHKASFQGPPFLLCFLLLAAQPPHGVWAQKLETDSCVPRKDKTENQTMHRNKCAAELGKERSFIDPCRRHRVMAAASTRPWERRFLGNVSNVHICQAFARWTLTCKWTQERMECVQIKAAPWTFPVHTHLCLL